MKLKTFYLSFILLILFILVQPYTCCFAQYTYNPNTTLAYPYYQPNVYTTYQTSSYLPNPAGNYLDPYNQAIAYQSYPSSFGSGLDPYGTASAYAFGNPYLNYNPLGLYGYTSLSAYNPYNVYGLPLNPAGIYNTGFNTTNTATYTGTTTGTTNSNDVLNTNGGIYTAQATTYYPTTYPGYPGFTFPFQLNPYSLPNLLVPNIYQNPFNNYLPTQNSYQNPYVSYPYNTGPTSAVTAYQGYPASAYNQPNPYTQPLPYYQTNYYPQGNTAGPSEESTLLSVGGNWTGTWFTTQANGTVSNGEVNLSLTQNGVEVTGTVSFSLNSYPKLSSTVNGTITGTSLTLVGSLFNGTNVYSLTMTSNITANNLSGTYTIQNNSGSVIESGTYSISHL